MGLVFLQISKQRYCHIFSRLYIFLINPFYFKVIEYSHEVVRHDTERLHMLFTFVFPCRTMVHITARILTLIQLTHLIHVSPVLHILVCVCVYVCISFYSIYRINRSCKSTNYPCQDNRSSSIIIKISRVAFTTPFPVFSPKTQQYVFHLYTYVVSRMLHKL